MKIKLDESELRIITDAARARTESNKLAGNHKGDHKVMAPPNKDQTNNEIIGLCGEIAVAKYLCIETPTLVFDQKHFREIKHSHKDVGEFEVKSTSYSSGKLILQKKHIADPKNKTTKYILCTISLQNDLKGAIVTIHGWSTPELMKLKGALVKSQYNESWRMDQSKLEPLSTLNSQQHDLTVEGAK